ncbi:MAG TPA: antibiotic biosynthesis monooxygenase [Tepidisphaeraceae bacterium]|nr:antibiotic biosynthesis monooxygenase [Tepidisphaeraceae bacterium]
MTTIGMHYDVLPGKEQEFVGGFLRTIDFLKTQPGHVESKLFEDVTEKGSYLILSQWRTRGDFDAFLRSDAFRQTTAWGKAELLRGRPRHKVYGDA